MVMLKQVFLLVLLISAKSVFADGVSNLYINSDNLLIDKNSMTAKFSGNVLLCFKDVKLLGDKIVFSFENEKNRKIKKIIIENNIKAFYYNNNTLISGDRAVYNASNSELEITGHVIVDLDGKVIITDKIIIYGDLIEVRDIKASDYKQKAK